MQKNRDRIAYSLDWASRAFFALTLVYLAYALAAVYAYDFLQWNVPLMPQWSVNDDLPMRWLVVFGEASTTELLQWLSLGTAFLLVFLALVLSLGTGSAFYALALFAFGLSWMLFEDYANIRHVITALIGEHWFGYEPMQAEWVRSTLRSIIELSIYAAMGVVMLVSYYLLLRNKLIIGQGFKYITAAYVLYAVAAIASASRYIGDWYTVAGTVVFDFIASVHNLPYSGADELYSRNPLGFWFMDYVLEESLELVAAAFICRGCCMLFCNRTKGRTQLATEARRADKF